MLQVVATMEAREVVSMRMPALSMVNTGTGSRQLGLTIFETLLFGVWSYHDAQWTEAQAEECADILFSEYHWLSMAELKLFTLRAKQGKFECMRNFAKFTPRMMALCFEEYVGELLPLRAGQRHLDSPKDQKQIEAPEFDTEPYIEQMIQIIGKRYDLNRAQREHQNISPEEFARQMGIDIEKLKTE